MKRFWSFLALIVAMFTLPTVALAQTTIPTGMVDPNLSNLEMWAMLSGFFLPVVLARVQNAAWPNERRALVAFVVCAIAGLIQIYLQGLFVWTDIVRTFLFTLSSALVFYLGFWKPLGVSKIERGQTAT